MQTIIITMHVKLFFPAKTWKMRYAHWWTWIMVRKLKNVGNETQIMYDLAYGKNIQKHGI